jgi:hypothetical protein
MWEGERSRRFRIKKVNVYLEQLLELHVGEGECLVLVGRRWKWTTRARKRDTRLWANHFTQNYTLVSRATRKLNMQGRC